MAFDLYDPNLFLAPTTVSLNQLLEGRFFHIPSYQRSYAWRGKEEVRQLWSDIQITVERTWTAGGSPVAARRPHFFGPVVVERREGNSGTVDVMDGQQRLVTFSILLAVLLDHTRAIADEGDRQNWSGSLSQLLFVYSGGAQRPRVKLGKSADAFEQLFCTGKTPGEREEVIASLGQGLPPELVAMLATFEFLSASVKEYLETDEGQDDGRLIRLVRCVLHLSLFLHMEVREQGVAYEVFEGLNARGLALSQADLVKNKLFELAQAQGTLTSVQSEWEAAYEAIQGQQMVEMPVFLQLHHIVYFGSVKATDLYNRVARETLTTVTAFEYAKSVRLAAERLQSTLDAGAVFTNSAIRHIERIRDVLTNRYALLPILASTGRFEINSLQFETILRLSHSFAFRRLVVEEAGLSAYEGELTKASQGLVADGSVHQFAETLNGFSTDGAFRSGFRLASCRTTKMGFYVCEMIEHYLGSSAGMLPNPQSPSQHLEHIFPKKPAAGHWPAVPKEEHDLYVNRIGNLLVLEASINQSIKNKGYLFKRSNLQGRDYQHSALKMPHHLDEFEVEGNWTLQSIERRQELLADKYAVLVWSLKVL